MVRIAVLLLTTGVAFAQPSPPPFYPDKTDLLVVSDPAGQVRPVASEADWAIRRRHLVANMEQVMGPLPPPSSEPLDVRVLEEVRLDGFTRRRISYATGDGDRSRAFLFLPHGRSGRLPALLHLHQTNAFGKAEVAGVAGRPDRQFAPEMARLGYVILAPDYPYFGEAITADPYALGYVSGAMKGIRNHMRAVDVLASLPQADPERIAAIGHSLGGHNSLFAAVFDPRIKAVVTSCGFNAFPKYYGGDLTGWSSDRYMPRIAAVYGKDPARMPFDFPEILAAIAPRPVFINAPLHDANFEVSGVRDCVRAALPVYESIYNAADRLVAVYPDAGHDFPPEIRREAYAFLDKWLGAPGR